jgi:hypothetical protein
MIVIDIRWARPQIVIERDGGLSFHDGLLQREQGDQAMNGRFSITAAMVLFAATVALAACQSLSPSPAISPNASARKTPLSQLKSASHLVCAHPKTTNQKVKLPTTGGVSGTMSFGAFPPKADGCDYVKISTGHDIETASGIAQFALRVGIDANAAAKPLLTISVGEGFDNLPVFDKSSIISGMQLKVSPGLNFPDGTYYATITKTSGNTITYTGVIAFTAKDGVLKVKPTNLPDGKNFPLVFLANTSSIITLYPRGVVPPPPTASPSPTPMGSPTPTPFPIPTGAPGTFGNPPPPPGALIGTVTYNYPDPPCNGVPYLCKATVEVYQGNGAPLIVHLAYGTVDYDLSSIAYMQLRSFSDDCPKDWTVNAHYSGTGHIEIPKDDPWVGQDCTIVLSTIPKRKHGSGYEEDVYFFAFGLRHALSASSTKP